LELLEFISAYKIFSIYNLYIMEIKIKREIDSLMKMNIPETMAMMIVYKKYDKLDELNSIIETVIEEQKEIEKEIENFVPFDRQELIKS
jgi:hypothetical protein